MKTKEVKELLKITPTNVWDSTKAKWITQKKKWNELINTAGEIAGVKNPAYATRENCLYPDSIPLSMNGGASVLDPFVCELLVKLFMPIKGKKIYNPFGGGVQMGFVAGFFDYEYLATEIRKNQCDVNNQICGAFQLKSKWIQANSAEYIPEDEYDMIFLCPPYYKVEKYVDYDGNSPQGELNSMGSYEEFKTALFAGIDKSIECLKDNCFICIMIGDSRDKNGAYYGIEAETELHLKNLGLHLYNRIVYIEKAGSSSLLAGRSIETRKLRKREQKIIVAFKGNLNNIKTLF